jgi:ABC-2 type transport system permease protein
MSTPTVTLPAITVETPGPLTRPKALRNSLTMAWRALLSTRHEPEIVTDAIAIPVFFTLLFTYVFGGALSGSTHSYLQYLLPGTLVMSVLLITVSAGISLSNDRARGALDRFRAMPVWQPAHIVGSLIGDMARYLLSVVLVIGLGLLMGYRPAGGAGGVVLGVLLILFFGFSVSWIWTSVAMVVRSVQAVSVLSFAFQFPLTFASNVYVRPATLPGWLRAFVDVNPVSHLVTAERALMSGTATAGQVGWALLASAALLAVFAPLTMFLYRTRP